MGEIERAARELRQVVVLDPSNAVMKEELVVLERQVEVMREQGLLTFL